MLVDCEVGKAWPQVLECDRGVAAAAIAQIVALALAGRLMPRQEDGLVQMRG